MERREFIKFCAATCAMSASESLAAKDLEPRFYSRAQLVTERGQPFKASSLAAGENYIFHYPFEGTPCFLLNLGRPAVREAKLRTEDGSIYRWPGGAGLRRAIVAYSAICAHRMTYPTPQITFISYREKSTAVGAMHRNVIHCCSEHSEFDPASGARVVGGPAPQPLCAILLEYDAREDGLHAIGTLGGELFNAFFDKFGFRLALDYGAERAGRPVTDRSVVQSLREFCKQQVRC